jgi:hypothetical protein
LNLSLFPTYKIGHLINVIGITPVVRALAKLGIGSYKERKRNKILQALDDQSLSIDDHIVKSDEFISAYLATEHALMMSSSKNKFDFLVGLFVQGSKSGRIEREPDAYQEVLSIIDELSERELTILYHIYNYEIENGEMKGKLTRDSEHQIKYLSQKTSLDRELIVALLVRLRRTGLIITFSERRTVKDLSLGGVEIMFISPIAAEIKEWVFGTIEGVFQVGP